MPAINTDERSEARANAALLEELERRFSPGGIRKRRLQRYRTVLWLVWVNVLSRTKRFTGFAASSILLLICAPVFIALYSINRAKGGSLERSPRLGRWGIVFEQYSFSSGYLRHLPALLNVWRGEMSFIGPRSISPGAVSAEERLAWKRFNTRPGLFCLWWLRSRTNIAYGTEIGTDVEYVDTQSFLGDLGIALRAIPATLYGEGVEEAPERVHLVGITINNLTMDEAVQEIVTRARNSVATQISFVNADCANIAWRNTAYRDVVRKSDLVLADGIGMKMAGSLLNSNIRQNVNGTDLFPRLCKVLQEEPMGIFLLGGKPGVAVDVAEWMEKNFPGVPVAGHHHGYFTADEAPEVVASIRNSNAKILLVAFGAPKQEQWISAHLSDVGPVVSLGVGGLFDFYSGRIPRAPAWVREIGMEWFFRFWQEPRRMGRRYLVGNLVFISRVLRERFSSAAPL
jgi:N-acetylglucosaminyldiphosphoundecaprenol N-acetyl-beta-D-mannosaminyltransferase